MVRGHETARYRVTIRCCEADLECSETTDVEDWIDDDGRVRPATVADGDAHITAEFFNLGRSVRVEAPPADKVADLRNPKLEDAEEAPPAAVVDLELCPLSAALSWMSEMGRPPPGLGTASASPSQPSVMQMRTSSSATSTARPIAERRLEWRRRRARVVGLRLRNLACSMLGSPPSVGTVTRLRAALKTLAR